MSFKTLQGLYLGYSRDVLGHGKPVTLRFTFNCSAFALGVSPAPCACLDIRYMPVFFPTVYAFLAAMISISRRVTATAKRLDCGVTRTGAPPSLSNRTKSLSSLR